MKNLKEVWKQLPVKHQYSAMTLQMCILKAIKAKSNLKPEILQSLIYRSYTPVSNRIKLDNGRYPFDRVYADAKYLACFGSTSELYQCMENDTEKEEYTNLLYSLFAEKMKFQDCYYLYFIVREDLSVPQKLIQIGHVALSLRDKVRVPKNISFVVFGVDNEETLKKKIAEVSKVIDCETFKEEDGSLTAITTYPVRSSFMKRKGVLDDCHLLSE